MEKKNIVVGMSIIGVLIILVLGMFVLQAIQPGKLIFSIQFDNANKLKAGDSIYVKGLKIGEVKSIELDNVQRVVVATVILHTKLDLPDDSFFFIWQDKLVTGSRCIQIKLGKNTSYIKRGDMIEGESGALKIVSQTGIGWLQSTGLWWEDIEKEIKEAGIWNEIKNLF